LEKQMTDNWQKNPVIIAAATFASTAALFMSIFVPILEKNNTNKINELESELKKEIKSKEKLSETITNLNHEIKKLNTNIVQLQSISNEYKNEDRFTEENPYPKGLRKIKIFSPYENIGTAHPNSNFNKNTIYFSIDIEDELFDRVIYYPIKCNGIDVVKEIRYTYNSEMKKYLKFVNANGVHSAKMPSDEQDTNSITAIKMAIHEIFRQKYELLETTNDGNHIFKTSKHTLALITDSYLSILTVHNDDQIIEICKTLLTCPTE
jgi:TolA-binding protein